MAKLSKKQAKGIAVLIETIQIAVFMQGEARRISDSFTSAADVALWMRAEARAGIALADEHGITLDCIERYRHTIQDWRESI